MLKGRVKTELLAILFTAREPVTLVEFSEVFSDLSSEEIAKALAALSIEFNSLQEAVEIRNVAGGYRLTTRPEIMK